jgi:tRNA-splicing endonuclease subunit Sen15
MLKAGVKETDMPLEREWVLPTHIREKWSLRKFAEVFDAVGKIPLGEGEEEKGGEGEDDKARGGGKRVLLATVGDDSTVLYYIVHDGIVKPRQN